MNLSKGVTSIGLTAIVASATLSLLLMGYFGSPKEANAMIGYYGCNYVKITAPQNGQNFSTDSGPQWITVKFSGYANSCNGMIAPSALTWYIDGNKWGTGSTIYISFLAGCSQVSHTASLGTMFPDGTYRYNVISFTVGRVC